MRHVEYNDKIDKVKVGFNLKETRTEGRGRVLLRADCQLL